MSDNVAPTPQLYTISAAAAVLGVSRSTAYRMIGAGHMRPIRIGGSTRITRAELDRVVGNATRVAAGLPAITYEQAHGLTDPTGHAITTHRPLN